mmetsp:Transcript_14595/g.61640  ORF Transcript_14595/g.61640 Transcript_14595/m.61640 type:complete len:210 (+) Transcript_14595:623-1252(+)
MVHHGEGVQVQRAAESRADGGVEGVDAGAVPAVPLLQGVGDVQRDTGVHRGVRVDDGLWQFFVLLRAEGLLLSQVRADDVEAQLLRVLRVPRDEERLRALLHMPDAHLVHVGGVLCALRRPRAQHQRQRRPRKIRDLLRRVLSVVGNSRGVHSCVRAVAGLVRVRGPEEAERGPDARVVLQERAGQVRVNSRDGVRVFSPSVRICDEKD